MTRISKFPLPKQELYFFDEKDRVYKPMVDSDGMLPIQSIQKKWKDPFTRDITDKWNVLTNVGATVDTSSGELWIDLGMAQGNEIVLETKETFTDPFRALLAYKFLASVTGQEWHFEAVVVDDTTKEATGRGGVGWRWKLKDDHATYNYYASYYTQNGALTPLYSSPASLSSTLTWTSYQIAELELFADEVWYHHRIMDSENGRAYSKVRHQQLPDPNALYKIRIRGKNIAVPSGANKFYSQFLTVVDYAELTAEITAGRGNSAQGQGIYATVGGSLSTVSTITTANTVPKLITGTVTTSAITTATPFTTSAIDAGSTMTYTSLRVRVIFDQPVKIDIYNGSSSTVTSNKIQATYNIPANTPTYIEEKLIARYIGVKVTNTGTATTTVHDCLYMLLS